MGDVVDRSEHEQTALMDAAVEAQRQKMQVTHESLTQCVDCEEPIPLARQKAVKGCLRCIGCQYEVELLGRQGVV